jgi:hypothetical protein
MNYLINYFGFDTIVANGSLPKLRQRSYNSNITLHQVFEHGMKIMDESNMVETF